MDTRQIIELMSRPGWDAIDAARAGKLPESGNLTPEALALGQLIGRVRATADGRRLFEWLVQAALLAPVYQLPQAGPDAAALADRAGWMAAGRQDLVRQMLRLDGFARHAANETEGSQEEGM